MSDESSHRHGLPVPAAPGGLTHEKIALIQRGLDLAASAKLSRALTELTAARSLCDSADRLLRGPNTWDGSSRDFLAPEEPLIVNGKSWGTFDARPFINESAWAEFAHHCRDAYRHAPRALAIHLGMSLVEPDVAERLQRRAEEDPASLPRGLFFDLSDKVHFFEHLVEQIESGDPEANRLGKESVGDFPGSFWQVLKWFIEDTAELIERGAVGIVFPFGNEIVRWLKNRGDRVERNEVLFEFSADRVVLPFPSPAAGNLADIPIREDGTVPDNGVVAIIYTR